MINKSITLECKLEHISGISKSGKPYNMVVLRIPNANASIPLANYGNFEHYKIKQLLKKGDS